MSTIGDTRFEMVQLVFPEDITPHGTLYGGRMMYWIATAGTLAASRCARGAVVLGAMDDLDFLGSVYLGEIVTLAAQVEHIGRASLEVGVEVHSESPRTGTRRRTTSSHLAFIALDDREGSRPVGQTITPGSAEEAEVYAAAAARRAARVARLRAEASLPSDPAWPALESLRHGTVFSRLVMPEDALNGTLMFAGKLLTILDEVASITAVRYCRRAVVTASLDTVYFTHPLRVGQIADIRAALTHVGRSSMEVGLRVDAEQPRTGDRHHTCTAFLTMVHLDANGRPAPVPPLTPETPVERRLWAEAESRRVERKARVARLRERVSLDAR